MKNVCLLSFIYYFSLEFSYEQVCSVGCLLLTRRFLSSTLFNLLLFPVCLMLQRMSGLCLCLFWKMIKMNENNLDRIKV